MLALLLEFLEECFRLHVIVAKTLSLSAQFQGASFGFNLDGAVAFVAELSPVSLDLWSSLVFFTRRPSTECDGGMCLFCLWP